MKYNIALLVSVFVLLSLVSVGFGQEYLVTDVTDGDTIRVCETSKVSEEGGCEEKTIPVRILGIDTPETPKTNQRLKKNKAGDFDSISDISCLDDWGLRAKNFAKEKLLNKYVDLEPDPSSSATFKKDYFKRTLAYVRIEGEDFSSLMLENGYAKVYRKVKIERRPSYITIEDQARSNNIGVWGNCQTSNIESCSTSYEIDGSHCFLASTYPDYIDEFETYEQGDEVCAAFNFCEAEQQTEETYIAVTQEPSCPEGADLVQEGEGIFSCILKNQNPDETGQYPKVKIENGVLTTADGNTFTPFCLSGTRQAFYITDSTGFLPIKDEKNCDLCENEKCLKKVIVERTEPEKNEIENPETIVDATLISDIGPPKLAETFTTEEPTEPEPQETGTRGDIFTNLFALIFQPLALLENLFGFFPPILAQQSGYEKTPRPARVGQCKPPHSWLGGCKTVPGVIFDSCECDWCSNQGYRTRAYKNWFSACSSVTTTTPSTGSGSIPGSREGPTTEPQDNDEDEPDRESMPPIGGNQNPSDTTSTRHTSVSPVTPIQNYCVVCFAVFKYARNEFINSVPVNYGQHTPIGYFDIGQTVPNDLECLITRTDREGVVKTYSYKTSVKQSDVEVNERISDVKLEVKKLPGTCTTYSFSQESLGKRIIDYNMYSGWRDFLGPKEGSYKYSWNS